MEVEPSQDGVDIEHGPDPMQITSVAINGANRADFSETDNCLPSIGPNATCAINVVFKPTGSGSRAATLLINGDAANLPQQVALIGTGLAAVPDFDVKAAPNSATVKRGQAAAFAVTVTPQGGFSQALTFACAGLPSGAGCVFSPGTVTPNGGAVTTTLKVTTTAPSGRAALLEPAFNWFRLQGGALAAAMVFFFSRRRRKSDSGRYGSSMLMILLVAVLFCTACGGGGGSASSSGPMSASGTPLGTSPITVTSTSGSGTTAVLHTVTLTLTVTQ